MVLLNILSYNISGSFSRSRLISRESYLWHLIAWRSLFRLSLYRFVLTFTLRSLTLTRVSRSQMITIASKTNLTRNGTTALISTEKNYQRDEIKIRLYLILHFVPQLHFWYFATSFTARYLSFLRGWFMNTSARKRSTNLKILVKCRLKRCCYY